MIAAQTLRELPGPVFERFGIIVQNGVNQTRAPASQQRSRILRVSCGAALLQNGMLSAASIRGNALLPKCSLLLCIEQNRRRALEDLHTLLP